MSDTVTIRRGQVTEAGQLGRLIATSFGHLDVAAWLVADEKERTEAMGGQFEIFVAHAAEHGDVYVAEDGSADGPLAVAVWFPDTPYPDVEDYDARLAAACGPYTQRFVALDEAMHHAHPEEEHAYLAFLAVAGSAQGQGIGSELLKAHHARLDSTATPAYLEASNLRSRELYLRHGFVDHAEPYGPAHLKCFYPMWREPK